ncbi:S-glutathionyl-(chloro)hydroquinone reductase [Malassezia pachydermatis]|uniref:Glutathione s-transferase n=1 Tax=Malassezia pachydermatis TaxID=77020 RepID=A0A0N0RSG4_9BASI|nr:glutathione s-transferase [Malassezia pachydermatis]KOS15172.1 glutathione s-transferase [Malassezia pachydermatis]
MSTKTNEPQSKPVWAGKDGRFNRQESTFRDEIKKGGQFEPERGRYKLIVAEACPWAHRALIVRKLKRMDEVPDLLPVTVVDSFLAQEGWSVAELQVDRPHVPGTGNNIPGHEDKKFLREFYLAADPNYEKRPTVPVVWDNKLNTIVNNESSDIIRFLDSCFDEFLPKEVQGVRYYPEELRSEIDEFHSWVYPQINNGVYRSGFATTPEAYEEAVIPLFEALERVDKLIGDKTYIFGGRLTEADIRLYTTIVRFDPVYFSHFKCNLYQIRSGKFPNLHRWLREMYWNHPGFKETTNFDSIKAHYYSSHIAINPTSIVPLGPKPHILPLDN